MFYNLNLLPTLPDRLYRSAEEIRRDMRNIRDGVGRMDSMLSVHNLRVGMLSECGADDLRKKIPALEEAVLDADKSLRLLVRFTKAITELGRELDEVVCALRE